VRSVGEVFSIPISEIYCDDDFNCRGYVAPIDVADLARDIKARGLDQPITVQPYNVGEFKWRIVCGHRRFKATVLNQATEINAIIRYDLDPVKAMVVNLTENLKRKNLNIVQEARALDRLKQEGYTPSAVAELIGQSKSWVNIRFKLLNLHSDIQKEAAAGLLTQDQINYVAGLTSLDAQFDAVKKFKTTKYNSERSKLPRGYTQDGPKKKIKRQRTKEEMFKMLEHMVPIFGETLASRAIAWCSGEVTDFEFFTDLRIVAEEEGITYFPPSEL
jgi:ParB/RepB/Spo0J family partition protein